MFKKEVFAYLLVGLSVLSRYLILIDPNLILDGDEAIIGLMARLLLDGELFPTYFIGQQYGLSTFEV